MQSKQSILQISDGGTLNWFANFVPKWILNTANAIHSAFDGCLEEFYSKGSLKGDIKFICIWKIRLHYHPTLMILAYPTETLSKLNSLYWNPPAHGNKVLIEDQVVWSTGNCSNDKDEWKLEIWQHFLRSWISARKDKGQAPCWNSALRDAAHGESVTAICFILSVLHTQDTAVDMSVFFHHLVQTVPLKLNSRPIFKKIWLIWRQTAGFRHYKEKVPFRNSNVKSRKDLLPLTKRS